ncbi:MAG: hypothetical protein ACP5HG_15040 [Anaerolineae bacterium]
MEFFDCNAFFGRPLRRPVAPVATVEALLAEMDRAGVARALVWHIAQHWFDPHHAVGVLINAEISDEDRHNICHRNAKALLAPIVPALCP